MKNTARVRKNTAAKRAASQVQKPVTNDADLIRRTADEFSLIEFTGNAACVLLLMQAADAKVCAKVNAGWESLDLPEFGSGVMDLARIVITEFQVRLKNFKAETMRFCAILRGEIPAIQTAEKLGPFRFEDSVSSLRHLLGLIGMACSDRRGDENNQIDHTTAWLFSNRLQGHFDALWKLRCDLEKAANAKGLAA
jgi:hypothetical protein